jgi:hypothetical protein
MAWRVKDDGFQLIDIRETVGELQLERFALDAVAEDLLGIPYQRMLNA